MRTVSPDCTGSRCVVGVAEVWVWVCPLGSTPSFFMTFRLWSPHWIAQYAMRKYAREIDQREQERTRHTCTKRPRQSVLMFKRNQASDSQKVPDSGRMRFPAMTATALSPRSTEPPSLITRSSESEEQAKRTLRWRR